jgi:hypothetical protein
MITDDLRLSIDQKSKHFKNYYSPCIEYEHYHSLFKNMEQKRMWVKKQNSVTNLNTLTHINLLAVAITIITTQSNYPYHKLKIIKKFYNLPVSYTS